MKWKINIIQQITQWKRVVFLLIENYQKGQLCYYISSSFLKHSMLKIDDDDDNDDDNNNNNKNNNDEDDWWLMMLFI